MNEPRFPTLAPVLRGSNSIACLSRFVCLCHLHPLLHCSPPPKRSLLFLSLFPPPPLSSLLDFGVFLFASWFLYLLLFLLCSRRAPTSRSHSCNRLCSPVQKTVGKGNFAKVKLAVHVATNVEVAIKIIDKSNLNEDSLVKLWREVRIMKVMDHPNIVKLIEVIDTDSTMYLVLEYAAGGEVFDYLVAHGRLKEKEARLKFRQILSAVEYCHARGCVHRDLKAENLLLDKDMNIKIADFGFANLYSAGTKLDTFCGSPPYAAPELFQGKRYDGPEVDVWSLGVILYTLVSGSLPFDGSNLKELRERVLRGKYRIPFYMSTECEQLLKKFLFIVPSKRISLRACMNEEWINMGVEQIAPYENSPNDYRDEVRLRRMESWGVPRAVVIESLESRSCNHHAGTYYLLAWATGLAPLEPATVIRSQSQQTMLGKTAPGGVLRLGLGLGEDLPESSATDDPLVSTTGGGGAGSDSSSQRPVSKVLMPRRATSAGVPQGRLPHMLRGSHGASTSTDGGDAEEGGDGSAVDVARDAPGAPQVVKLVRRHTDNVMTRASVAGGGAAGSTKAVPISDLRTKSSKPQELRGRVRRVTDPGTGGAAAAAADNLTSSAPRATTPSGAKPRFLQSLRKRFSRSVIETPVPGAPPPSFPKSKPRSLRFAFGLASTSEKPADAIMDEMRRVLKANSIKFQQQEAYLVVCNQENVHFEMEVCKLPRLNNVHGIRHKRISGQSLPYKNFCSKILMEMDI